MHGERGGSKELSGDPRHGCDFSHGEQEDRGVNHLNMAIVLGTDRAPLGG